MLNGKKVVAGALMGLFLAVSVNTVHAGMFDWFHHLFGKKSTVETPKLNVSKLDSSSEWMAKIAGHCAGGEGLCCPNGVKKHLKKVKNIEHFEVDYKSGWVTMSIKEGKVVRVKNIQKAFGSHWIIKTIKKSEVKS